MKKLTVLTYGTINYALGSGSLVLLIAFLFNLVPANPLFGNIDGAQTSSTATALAINIGLIILFGIQHSVMARRSFKNWLTRYIPQAAERGTYMMATGLVVFLVVALWQPMTGSIWQVENTAIHASLLAIGLGGWALVLYATFLINHFDLFGLRQVWLYFTGKAYTPPPFKLTGLYKVIRHPIMTGALIGIWVAPEMTIGHLMFAIGMTTYILIGVYHEEKDLIREFGERYRQYIRSTGKFFPMPGKVAGSTPTGDGLTVSD